MMRSSRTSANVGRAVVADDEKMERWRASPLHAATDQSAPLRSLFSLLDDDLWV
jgi:hypothetical protein